MRKLGSLIILGLVAVSTTAQEMFLKANIDNDAYKPVR
jgi:hypothetical protein